jgi:3-methylfumaryl-CoA hydratase
MKSGDELPESGKGRIETLQDSLVARPLRALAALLDRDLNCRTGDALPAPAHWLYFLPAAPQSLIGEDGHERRGGFLPHISLPRRMWAGSRIDFHRPIQVGDQLSRTSRIADVSSKQGKSGALVFVRVTHAIHRGDDLMISEEQDLVFRDAPAPGAPPVAAAPAPIDATWKRDITPDPVLLFRYSALTFNAHRIHYDRPYAMQVEHYPGLVVHGPLIATLLLDLLYRSMPTAIVRHFSFRAVSPLFDQSVFQVCGKPDSLDPNCVQLWAQNAHGGLAMEAKALLA